jgi:hypothetical protein
MIGMYDRKGNPISDEEWGRLRKDKRVALYEDEEKGITVSTVWLGLEHGFDNGLPIIFETMVFGGDFDGEQERYCTEEEAIAGHQKWVKAVQGDSLTSASL